MSYASRMALGLLLTALLGRTLEPSAFGFFTLVSTFYLASQALLDLGVGTLAVREIAREPSRERALVEGLMGWRLVSGLCLGAAATGAALLEPDATRRSIWVAVAASLLLLAPGALTPVFQVRQALGAPGLVSAAGQLLVILGLALGGARGLGPNAAWLLVARELLTAGLLGLLAARLLGYVPRPGLRARGLREFFVAAGVFAAAVLAHELSFHADVFLVRWLRGEVELGAYAAALRPLNPLLGLPLVLATPLLPTLAGSAARARSEFASQVAGAASLMAAAGAVSAAAGAGFARDVIQVLYHGRYLDGALEAVSAFRWLSLALGLACVGAPYMTALIADRRERLVLVICASGLAANLVGNLWLLPRFGFVAAAVTTAATEAVASGLAIVAFRSRHGRAPAAVSAPLVLALVGAVLAAAVALPGGALPRAVIGAALAGGAVLAIFATPQARAFRRGLEHASVASSRDEARGVA